MKCHYDHYIASAFTFCERYEIDKVRTTENQSDVNCKFCINEIKRHGYFKDKGDE